MPNISMALVDDHFLHGQVAELWCNKIESNLIIVINDKLYENKIQQGLLDMAVPNEISCRYYSVNKAIKMLNKLNDQKRPILIFETLMDLKILMNLGFSIPVITLASVPPSGGSRTVAPGVSLNSKQIAWLSELESNGVKIDIRQIPTEEGETLSDILNK